MTDANITNLRVEGMTCANCARSVEKVLKKNGVEDIYVDFLNDEVSYSEKPGIEKSMVKSEIEKIGYKVSDIAQDDPHAGHDHGGVGWKLAVSLALAIPLLIFHFFMFFEQIAHVDVATLD